MNQPMSDLLSLAETPVKTIIIGDTGTAKSGMTISLLCAGYRVGMIDTDNGARTLKGLIHPTNYPYYAYCQQKGIDISKNFNICDFSIKMGMRTVSKKTEGREVRETLLAPKNANAWNEIIEHLEHWQDKPLGLDWGHISTWDNNCVLILDSFTTISRMAYYFNQQLNNRLGLSETGYSHQQDVGGAQSQLRRLLEMIYNPEIKCHVVLICHINSIDDSRGFDQTSANRHMNEPQAIINSRGFPRSVGVALSKQVGIYFCDSFVATQAGSGVNVRYELHTVPTEVNGTIVGAKNSSKLKRTYFAETALAEIFAALRGQDPPEELIKALGHKTGKE